MHMDLVALEEIRQVKYRYLRCVDLKLWDDLAAVFTPDATVDYGTMVYGRPLKLSGRDEIVAFLRDKLGPDMITVHSAGQPEISIDGSEAAGTWSFEDTVIATAHRVVIKGAAFYTDRYRRGDDGRWRIAHTGYVRTYEAMLSLDDLPSFHASASRVTGLADFGRDDYTDGLGVLLESYAQDAGLSLAGEKAARALLRGALVARLLSEAGWQAHPAWATRSVERPVFVTGLPRTGTTALHRLLVADSAHQGLELWLAEAPQPRPPRSAWAGDPVFQHISAAWREHRYALADFGLTGAEVDERFGCIPRGGGRGKPSKR